MSSRLSSDSANIQRYLSRIGYKGSTVPSLSTLTLITCHQRLVPFETLDIGRKVTVTVHEAAAMTKVVDSRRGGFCYELNGAFARLLEALTYPVRRLSCRVIGRDGEPGPEFDHLALAVTVDDDTYLVDVGFGESPRAPLRLKSGAHHRAAGIENTIIEHNGQLSLRQSSLSQRNDGYLISPIPRRSEEFADMCQYYQTSPDSPFTGHRLCSLATDVGRITLYDRRSIETANGIKTERTLADDAEFFELLASVFGIRSPRRFRPHRPA